MIPPKTNAIRAAATTTSTNVKAHDLIHAARDEITMRIFLGQLMLSCLVARCQIAKSLPHRPASHFSKNPAKKQDEVSCFND
jgi:hypothetical protein